MYRNVPDFYIILANNILGILKIELLIYLLRLIHQASRQTVSDSAQALPRIVMLSLQD
jgi:hypothetical protein